MDRLLASVLIQQSIIQMSKGILGYIFLSYIFANEEIIIHFRKLWIKIASKKFKIIVQLVIECAFSYLLLY